MEISRREFLKTLEVAGTSLLPFQISTIQAEETQGLKEKRQIQLDDFFEKNKGIFPHTKKLTYEESPNIFFIEKVIAEELFKPTEGLIFIPVDGNKIRGSYAYVIPRIENFGKKQKQDVYVFPKAFKLKEKELEIILFHEDFHCRDVYNGIRLNNEVFEASKLKPFVLENIMELRSGFFQLEYILKKAVSRGEDFLHDVRVEFIQEREREYVKAYSNLGTLIEKGKPSDYETSAIRKHLIGFDKWMAKKSRYQEKRSENGNK
ncbi:MAG: hypothetical protein ABIG37_00750 [Nanoarchaeota archaeon]|nr:hypothetical protein [Nanoarchaeota archaeon]